MEERRDGRLFAPRHARLAATVAAAALLTLWPKLHYFDLLLNCYAELARNENTVWVNLGILLFALASLTSLRLSQFMT